MIRGDVRFFVFVVARGRARRSRNLGLPARTRAILVYRGDKSIPARSPTPGLKADDEVVLLTGAGQLAALREQFADQARPAGSGGVMGAGGGGIAEGPSPGRCPPSRV